jgi:hypothetical protein
MSGIRRWLRLRNVERDVDEEIASYFQEAVRDLEARGWTRGAAEEEARRRFGDARQYRRELLAIDRVAAVRRRWAWRVDALRDVVKHAARSVARSPALSLGIVLAFALGIGANATMFETVERLLLRPPPHIVDPDGVRRVLVYRQMIAEKMHSDIMTYPDYVDIASAAGFAQVAPYTSQELTVGAGAEAERVRTILVGASYWTGSGCGRWRGLLRACRSRRRRRRRVRGGDFGLDPWHAAFALPSFREGSIAPQERHALLQTGAERLARLPGVTAAAAARGVPFWSIYGTYLRIPGVDSIPRTAAGRPYVYMVTNDYFRTLRIERVRGRLFDERDTPTSARVVVVNESFARVVWPDGEPLGKCMHIGAEDAPCAEVVGIVRDARRFNLIEDDVALQYYVPLQQQENARPDGILLRIAGDSDRSTVLAAVQRELLGLDARVRFVRHMPLEELVAPELRKWRLGATMFSLFGLLALLVAAIGLYSVLAFDVAQRVREIGLRTALGASTRSIVALVVSRAVRITVVGVVVGAFVALVFAPRLRAFLYGVEPRDPLTFALVAVSLTVISLIAAGLPAWRAARVDPNVALRAE